MKVEVKNECNFTLIELNIKIETIEEFKFLKALFGRNVTVPNVLLTLGGCDMSESDMGLLMDKIVVELNKY
jgi:hypothetical protein